jgi:hypothetical protein
MPRTKKAKQRARDDANQKAKNMNPEASKRREEKFKTRVAGTAVALKEGRIVSGNTRSRVRRRGLDGLMGEMESLSIGSIAEPAITSPHQQQGITILCAPQDRLPKGHRLTSTPANNYFHRVSPGRIWPSLESFIHSQRFKFQNPAMSLSSFSVLDHPLTKLFLAILFC